MFGPVGITFVKVSYVYVHQPLFCNNIQYRNVQCAVTVSITFSQYVSLSLAVSAMKNSVSAFGFGVSFIYLHWLIMDNNDSLDEAEIPLRYTVQEFMITCYPIIKAYI